MKLNGLWYKNAEDDKYKIELDNESELEYAIQISPPGQVIIFGNKKWIVEKMAKPIK